MNEDYIKIYHDRSVYVSRGTEREYIEGPQSLQASRNQDKIKATLDAGYLDQIIINSFLTDQEQSLVFPALQNALINLVGSITSEVGRAIVGLTVLQLTVKAIVPEQSIRLHKAARNRSGFSWVDGIPMRVLDNTYITPKLREHNLLKLNADGFMMTRSLAENYPYTALYKASIRGAKGEWVLIVDAVEAEPKSALPALKLLITLLKQRSEEFAKLVDNSTHRVQTFLANNHSVDSIKRKLFSFSPNSSYSARLFEILIHSFYCTLSDNLKLPLFLKPLSQMRSANKKHGNIGDIELLERKNSMTIIESWDAKYGKTYLRDELEELRDKLETHPETKLAGFVTDSTPILNSEIKTRVQELEEMFDTVIRIESLEMWYTNAISEYRIDNEDVFLKQWLSTFFDYLFLKKMYFAPIDEPTNVWIEECLKIL